MAKSGSFKGSIFSGGYTLRVDWTAAQSVSGNYSEITLVPYLVLKSSYSLYIGARTDNAATVAGTKYTWDSTAVRSAGGQTFKLGSVKTGKISHNADGTKQITASFTFYIRATISGTYYEKITASATITLDTIPRATTPTLSVSSADMGASITINTPRASSSFTHDLAYSFAGSAYKSIATGVGTSKAWTVPDLASSIPNSTSGTMTIRCITKNGSTTIGTKTVLLTAKVPASVVPTISDVSTTETVAGIAEQFGAFVQSRSRVKVGITAAGAKGSTIKSISSTFLGKTYTGASWTSDLIPGSGTAQIKTTVKDSRGRTATINTPVTALAYSPPAVTTFRAERCDANGKPASDGVYVRLRYIYSVAKVGDKNTASMRIEWKKSTDANYDDTAVWTSSQLAQDVTNVAEHLTFSTDNQYDFLLTLTDWFGATAVYSASIPTGHVIVDLFAEGNAISFGKVAELPDLADFGYQIRTVGGFSPLILADSSNFNDLKTPNHYTLKDTAEAGYLNCPLTDGFGSLDVEPAGDGGKVRQIVKNCDKNKPASWERYYYGSAWGAWKITKGSSGWVELTIASGFSAYSVGSSEPRCKNNSGVVTLTGVLKTDKTIAASNEAVTIASGIPADCRPDRTYRFICQGGSEKRWECTVKPDGTIGCARYGSGSLEAITAGVWLPFTITYVL